MDTRSTRDSRRTAAMMGWGLPSCCKSHVILATPTLSVNIPSTTSKRTAKDFERPSPPTRYVPDSSSPPTTQYSSPNLHYLFGCRKVDYNLLPHLGQCLKVPRSESTPLSVGDVVNIKRGNWGGRLLDRPMPVTLSPLTLDMVMEPALECTNTASLSPT